MSSAYPVAGLFLDQVNYAAGALSPVSSIVAPCDHGHAVIFHRRLRELPKAALAAIVMVSVLNLIDLDSWRNN